MSTFKRLLLTTLIVLSPLLLFAQNENIKIIHAGKLLAVPGEKPLNEQTVVIKNNIIELVKSGYATSKNLGYEGAEVINLKDKFVLPGLMDMHTHITGQRDPNANRHEWTTLNDEDMAFRSIPYLERTLDAGFTTVRNLGAQYTNILAIKRAIGQNIIDGPRIISATGAVSASGGHGDSHGYRAEIHNAFEKSVGVCDGADDCRRAVRELVKQGADVIKITATGGVLSNTAAGVGQQLTDDELVAIVETAHSLGRKVAAHAHAADGINAALKAGVNSIEHGSYLDDTSVKLFVDNDAYFVPTLLAGVWLSEEILTNKTIPPAIADKINQVVPVVEASFKRALKGNVKIAFGTDSGVSPHGSNAREFELMVKYGMNESDAIKSATLNTADLLNMQDKLGSIEKGKYADIIAVTGDPLKDISILKSVDFVMKEGSVYKQ